MTTENSLPDLTSEYKEIISSSEFYNDFKVLAMTYLVLTKLDAYINVLNLEEFMKSAISHLQKDKNFRELWKSYVALKEKNPEEFDADDEFFTNESLIYYEIPFMSVFPIFSDLLKRHRDGYIHSSSSGSDDREYTFIKKLYDLIYSHKKEEMKMID